MKSTYILVPLLALLAAGGLSQQEMELNRLDQQVRSLQYKLDYETQRMEQRIESLERQVRQFELTPVPTREPLSRPVLPLPAPVAEELTVRRLVITDDAGRIRGVFAVSDLFGPMVSLLSEQGDVVALLTAPAAGGRLELLDAFTRQRVLLGMDPELRFDLRDEDGELVPVPMRERR